MAFHVKVHSMAEQVFIFYKNEQSLG